MARNTQLLQLVQMVREECGRASSLAVGVGDVEAIKTKIRRTQELLYDDWDWPHMRQFFTREDMSAGERYYDPTDGVDFERIERMVIWYNGLSHDITTRKGIEFCHYNIYDSENDVRSDPVQRWDVRWTGKREQIEFWPIPSTNDQQFQIQGIRQLRSLVNDSDRCDLDDQLLALTVASELLAVKDSKSAQLVSGLATKRLNDLRAKPRTAGKRYRMGMGEGHQHNEIVLRVGSR